jgi:hypothetical protein
MAAGVGPAYPHEAGNETVNEPLDVVFVVTPTTEARPELVINDESD